MSERIAVDWRLKAARYRLEGTTCIHCGEKLFPPRKICPVCNRPANEPDEVYLHSALCDAEWRASYPLTITAPTPFQEKSAIAVLLIEP